MTKDEALKLLRGGNEGIAEWNRRRDAVEDVPSLRDTDLNYAKLRGADLGAADLNAAHLRYADLSGADLSNANLHYANLTSADLRGACLSGANLDSANLCDANLSNANLSEAILIRSVLMRCDLSDTDFFNAHWGSTTVVGVDLRKAHGLESILFLGPSSIGVDTLVRSAGQVPEAFLRGCGFQPWQVIQAKTYDPSLTRDQFKGLQYKVEVARNQGPLYIGSVFISYSHEDTRFVDKLYGRLVEEGAPVWLDRHDLIAGDIQNQIGSAIRLNDVVLLVLSKSSVNSDWVRHELEMARKKEKDEGRDVICPVALDDAWKARMDDILWPQVMKKNVLDFSKWKTRAFAKMFEKLVTGLRISYRPVDKAKRTGKTAR